MQRGFSAHLGNSVCKKKENRDQMHKGRGFFQSIKPQGFFLTLTSSKAENKTKIHVCKWRCYVKSWFERLWQPESGGYSWTRASEVDITIGTPYTLPCSPCMPAAPSLAGALKLGQRLNSPTILLKSTQELKRALGWDVTRCASFEAFGEFGSCLN